jgi:hypothetical protein
MTAPTGVTVNNGVITFDPIYGTDAVNAVMEAFMEYGQRCLPPESVDQCPDDIVGYDNSLSGHQRTALFKITDAECNDRFRVWAEEQACDLEFEFEGVLCHADFAFRGENTYLLAWTTEGEPTEDALFAMFAELEDEQEGEN